MRLPKYDILLPTLFVGVIFPGMAGGWWRYFSGYADQVASPVVQIQTLPQVSEQTAVESRGAVHVARMTRSMPLGNRRVTRMHESSNPRPTIPDESSLDELSVDEGPIN